MKDTSKILVTGAGGFIGSHLVEELLRRGKEVRAFVRYTSHGGHGWLADLPPELREGLQVHLGDLRDRRSVAEAARGCSTIYHLAALIGIPYSYEAPASYVDVNVSGTLNVLEAARELEVDRTVVTSTSEVYGTAQYTPIDELHPLRAQSPYAASKIAADQLALSYHRSFELPVAVVRPFNTYGPRQSARAVVPTIMAQALVSDRLRLGNLDPVRDLVHVSDTVAGFIALGESNPAIGQVTQLATGVGVSIAEVAERILRLVGRKVTLEQPEERRRPESSEVYELIGSADLARQRAGWEPRIALEEGLEQTLAWVREHLDRYTVETYSV